jgi:hypothetical protein
MRIDTPGVYSEKSSNSNMFSASGSAHNTRQYISQQNQDKNQFLYTQQQLNSGASNFSTQVPQPFYAPPQSKGVTSTHNNFVRSGTSGAPSMVEMKKTISSKTVVPGAGNTLPIGGGINTSDYKGVRSNSKPEN